MCELLAPLVLPSCGRTPRWVCASPVTSAASRSCSGRSAVQHAPTWSARVGRLKGLAGVAVRLSVERLMLAALLEEDHRRQAGPRPAPPRGTMWNGAGACLDCSRGSSRREGWRARQGAAAASPIVFRPLPAIPTRQNGLGGPAIIEARWGTFETCFSIAAPSWSGLCIAQSRRGAGCAARGARTSPGRICRRHFSRTSVTAAPAASGA